MSRSPPIGSTEQLDDASIEKLEAETPLIKISGPRSRNPRRVDSDTAPRPSDK